MSSSLGGPLPTTHTEDSQPNSKLGRALTTMYKTGAHSSGSDAVALTSVPRVPPAQLSEEQRSDPPECERSSCSSAEIHCPPRHPLCGRRGCASVVFPTVTRMLLFWLLTTVSSCSPWGDFHSKVQSPAPPARPGLPPQVCARVLAGPVCVLTGANAGLSPAEAKHSDECAGRSEPPPPIDSQHR